MTEEHHFNDDEEMDAWIEDDAAESFDDMPPATEAEMPSGGSVRLAIVVSSVPPAEGTQGATGSVTPESPDLVTA